MIPDHATDNAVSNVTALGALMSPLWLHTLSDWAATALPILGATYLLLQGYVFIRNNFFQKKDPK